MLRPLPELLSTTAVRARWDETWHRLREWTNGQAQSERLAGQVMLDQGFSGFDPSHPLGGRDGRKDAIATKDGKRWVMAVYFPRSRGAFKSISKKLLHDLKGVTRNNAVGLVFVTNQELTLGQREALKNLAASGGRTAGRRARKRSTDDVALELYHLERVTTILDQPHMAPVRKQFLNIDDSGGGHVYNIGGAGGAAPGAGGGGGSAIGGGRGGDGGPGGSIRLHGEQGQLPGAGGGGAAGVGPNAAGGDGGGGGEIVEFILEVEPGKSYEYKCGEGGRGGGPGQDGEDGGDASFAGIVAKGGKVGKAAPPWGSRTLRVAQQADLADGLRASVALAEVVHVRAGLLYLLAGGWEFCTITAIPGEAIWPVAISIDLERVQDALKLALEVVDPSGRVVASDSTTIWREGTAPIVRRNLTTLMRFQVSAAGLWTLRLISGEIELARHPVEIKSTG